MNIAKSIALLFFFAVNLWARPNVIVVMTDDQGYPELSVHGNPVLQTPNLDLLHGQSVRLSDYHVSPMCTPPRGQLLTGLDAARTGAVNGLRSSARTPAGPASSGKSDHGQLFRRCGLFHRRLRKMAFGSELSFPPAGPGLSGKRLVPVLLHPLGTRLLGQRLL